MTKGWCGTATSCQGGRDGLRWEEDVCRLMKRETSEDRYVTPVTDFENICVYTLSGKS